MAYKDGAVDLIIGNVPFGKVKYNYKEKYLIHDYFFVKVIDNLNNGLIQQRVKKLYRHKKICELLEKY